MKDKNTCAEENNGIKNENVAEAEMTAEENKEAGTAADGTAEKIKELEAELKELGDKYLRMAAEYDNFRRRTREEKDSLYASAVADTVGALLPIVDNLERASMYEELEKVKEGLLMTAKSVESVFASLKVESVGKVGEKFDPTYHNAVLHEEDESLGEGEITEVFQKGYKKGNKIIRFAMVKTVN